MTPPTDWLLDKLSTLPVDPNQRALFPEREPAPERTRGLPMFAREWRRIGWGERVVVVRDNKQQHEPEAGEGADHESA